ncbi:MAG: hypothetical protein IKT31_06675, partial [Firmicutes bacterium]|nr:hypothetical protein [Bacillota bacterium]
ASLVRMRFGSSSLLNSSNKKKIPSRKRWDFSFSLNWLRAGLNSRAWGGFDNLIKRIESKSEKPHPYQG